MKLFLAEFINSQSKMRRTIVLSVLSVILSAPFSAQFNFEYNDSIKVFNGANELNLAWAGGQNYAQFSDLDFDFDGDMDLFVFDRSNDLCKVYIQENVNGNKFYRLMYNAHLYFPSDMKYRANLVDYNQDGKKDLFAYGIGGIKVYKNTGDATNGLSWQLAKNLLYSNYWGANLNLYVSSADIPAIVDVEGDGDIDILTFHIGGEHLQYHQNQSMDLYGVPDSLEFVLKNECWGGFREDLNTSTVYLNDPSIECTTGNVPGAEYPVIEGTTKPTEQTPKHAGSTVLAIDINNSGVLDLILGDVAYPNLNLLMNSGTTPNSNSSMVSVTNNFPSNSLPANMNLFPAAFWVDVDFDNKKDLIVGANAKNISENEKSILYYKNLGTNQQPTFVYQTNAFLQNEMIEHGTGTVPVFADIDGDGLQDLFVANFYRYKPTLSKESSIAYYKNTGTLTNPVFSLVDNDFLNFSSASLGLHIIPTFGDIDGDNDQDLILGLENGLLQLYRNNGTPTSASFSITPILVQDNSGINISSGQYATPQLFDLNKDNLLDLIIGRKTGELMYYENIGTLSSASFQLANDTLGKIDVATSSPDGFPVPHFFNLNDTTYLFLGSVDGKLLYYSGIDNHLDSDSSFNLVASDFLNINVGAYSSFSVNDIDQDGRLNLFIGQDLGGLYHLEVDPNSNASVNNIDLDSEFDVYPNPFNENIHIQPINDEVFSLRITNTLGQIIYQLENQSGQIILDFNDEEKGLYIVQIQKNNTFVQTKKIIKN
jgi:hypothetical protein